MYIFQAVDRPEIIQQFYEKKGRKLNILIAYNNLKSNEYKLTDLYRDYINMLYLDSGAYSVYTGKSQIDVHEYRQYLKLRGHKYTACFNLDDRFDDPDHNLQNQLYLERGLTSNGIKPIPVIHDKNDPFAEFEMYVDLGHDYIAIGSSGSRGSKDRLLEQASVKYPNVKIHLFGDLDRKLLYKFQPYSADSASWAHQAGIGGGIYYWRSIENKEYFYNVGGREFFAGGQHIRKSPFWAGGIKW